MNKLSFFFFLVTLGVACDSATVEPAEGCDNLIATYDTNVKPIIDQTCAYSSCHVSGGIGPGDYSTYSGLSNIITNGSFVNRVIDQAANPSIGMPPDMSIYSFSLQDDLSPDQMEIIMCWIDAGFPEG